MTQLAVLIYKRNIRHPDGKYTYEVMIGDIVLEALSDMHAHTLAHQFKTAIDTHTTCGASIIPVAENAK